MVDQALWDYCSCEWFYERFQPLSPYGFQERHRRTFYTDESALAFEHQLIELLLSFIRDQKLSPMLDMIKGALARLTLLSENLTGLTDADEIFVVKRFLFNAQVIHRHLSGPMADLFGFNAFPQELLAELARAQSGGESFFVADGYDARLCEIRQKLEKLAHEVKEKHAQTQKVIKQTLGIDFSEREFVVISADRLQDLAVHTALVSVENHDGTHILLRPRASAQSIAAEHELWQLRGQEQAIEREVCTRLGEQIALHEGVLRELELILGRLDAALAKAVLAHEFRLTKPLLAGDLSVSGGRFLPLEDECGRRSCVYTPLELKLKAKGGLIYGSNMGGKSVVLKSVGFLQVLTQLGFYVPADRYTTRLYGSLSFIGARAMGGGDGLSGFGAEVFQFQERWQQRAGQALFLIDEFASTTNAKEAMALSQALIETLFANPGVFFLMATHFIKDGPLTVPVKIMRMCGIDRVQLEALSKEQGEAQTPAQKVRLLNKCMTYKIVEQDEVRMVREALRVAAFLGLDPDILKRAESQMESDDESQQT